MKGDEIKSIARLIGHASTIEEVAADSWQCTYVLNTCNIISGGGVVRGLGVDVNSSSSRSAQFDELAEAVAELHETIGDVGTEIVFARR